MPPLVALRYKEWAYGVQTPWEEEERREELPTLRLFKETWLSKLGDMVPLKKGQNSLLKQPCQKTSKNGFRVVFLDTYENPSQNSHFLCQKVVIFLGKRAVFKKCHSS